MRLRVEARRATRFHGLYSVRHLPMTLLHSLSLTSARFVSPLAPLRQCLSQRQAHPKWVRQYVKASHRLFSALTAMSAAVSNGYGRLEGLGSYRRVHNETRRGHGERLC